MKLDKDGLDKLHEREGLRLKPYLDTRGIPTIAMGNTYYLDGKKVAIHDNPITLSMANELANKVSNDFAKYVDSIVRSKVSQNKFNALVSLAYNIGKTGFANSTVLRLVNKDPNDKSIEKAFMMWTKNPELIGRRKSEVKQYFTL